jgi:hypothetical protein
MKRSKMMRTIDCNQVTPGLWEYNIGLDSGALVWIVLEEREEATSRGTLLCSKQQTKKLPCGVSWLLAGCWRSLRSPEAPCFVIEVAPSFGMRENSENKTPEASAGPADSRTGLRFW